MRQTVLVLLTLLFCSCGWKTPSDKINGVSFVGSRDAASQAHVESVVNLNADYAAVMPFGFIRELGSPEITYDTDRQWFGETRAGARQYIELLHKNGIGVMLKPQIWIWRGVFTGDLEMESEADWLRLEESYSDFVMSFARLAEETGAEMFCIGTELEEFVKARPGYWARLIEEIREVYSGKLTYAANWDEYKNTPFWDALDYVGVDAYFPLSDARDPSVLELRESWKRWKKEIREVSEKADRPVLFTEYGYRSMDYTAKKPWLVDRSEQRVNLDAQANAKIALFEEFWDESWFAGGFVWKWFIHHPVSGGPSDNRFTPQNKPAENVIREYYQRHR